MIEKNINLQRDINSLATELATRYEEINLFYSLGEKLKVGEALTGTIRHIIKEVSYIFRGDVIVLSIPYKEIFEYVPGSISYSDNKLSYIVNKIREGCNSGKAHIIVVNTPDKFKGIGLGNKNWMKFIATSIKVKDEYRGVLTVLRSSQGKDYTTGDLKLLAVIGEHLSIIITNDELYQDMKDFLLNLVKSMVSAIEAKDEYTRGHSERVSKISVIIAKAMGLPGKDMENIRWASILHDIGKIGVPEQVLTKPGRLTEEEYGLVKTHPRKGYEILNPIVQLKDAIEGILYHQERYDGKGYPKGLMGEDIPLYARVIAVADTYDSITSRRAYRDSNSHMNAMREIERVSGSQLDPVIVEVFKRVCDKHPDFIRENNPPKSPFRKGGKGGFEGFSDEDKKNKDRCNKLHRA